MQKPTFEKPRLPEGIYEAKLKEVKDVNPGKYGDRVAWIFEIIEHSQDLAYLTYKNASLNSRCTQVYVALGGKFVEGKNFDTDKLEGKPVRVMVEDYKDNDGNVFSTISKVKPFDSEYYEEVVE